MQHDTTYTVLLIESDASLRRMITLGLQYRSMYVLQASSPSTLRSFEAKQPSLVVVDIDDWTGSNFSLLETIQSHPFLSIVPIVVLAWDCLLPASIHQDASQMKVTCLAKPFDARTLYATIEQILVTTKAIPSAQKQEMLTASRSVTPAPSIWPLVTAIGLLLAFTGLMLQITITALGLLIVMVALLWWTLGTKTERDPLAVEMGQILSTSTH